MSTEVAPLTKVQDQIKDRIKAEFVNLIPDDMWKAMVESVVHDFTTRPRPQYSGHPVQPSPLESLIRDELEAIAKGHVKAEIDMLAMGTWDGYGNQVASDALKKLVSDNFNDILAGIQKGMADNLTQYALNAIRNGMSR